MDTVPLGLCHHLVGEWKCERTRWNKMDAESVARLLRRV